MVFLKAAVLLLLSIAFSPWCCYAMLLDDAQFTQRTEHGMSRARTPTYDYQYDPEVFKGYTRQDNRHNGTAIGASGNYFLTHMADDKDIFFRIDNRDCKQNRDSKPKSCICYVTSAKVGRNDLCDGKAMAHVCQNEKAGEGPVFSYTDDSGKKQKLISERGKLSVHLKFNIKAQTVKAALTDYLGGGLHLANVWKDYIPSNVAEFDLSNTYTDELASKKIAPLALTPKYVFGKDITTYAITLHFPTDGCARLDFHGIAYGGQLLLDEKPKPIDIFVDDSKPPASKPCQQCPCS